MKKQDVTSQAAEIINDVLKELKIDIYNEDVQQLVLNGSVALDNLYFNHYTGGVDAIEFAEKNNE